jgi:hypothetical protein
MSKLSPEQLKERHQEKMMKDLVKNSNKYLEKHPELKRVMDEGVPTDEDKEDFFRRTQGIEYRQEQKQGLVEIFVKLTLPIKAYETAAGLYRIADYRSFDDYVSDCVMQDLALMCQGEVADDVVISKLTGRETEYGAPYTSEDEGGT